MKLIVLRNNLLDALFNTEKAVGDNANLPILKNILLKTENNKIFIITTNLELAVSSVVSGKIIENGETTIPHSILNNIVKNLAADRINLAYKNKQLTVTTDNYEAVIQCQNPKEFPIIPTVHSKKESIRIKTDYFKEVLGNVVVATQYSDIRPEISGVFLYQKDGDLMVVATDSFRLAEKKLDRNYYELNEEDIAVTIPLKTTLEILRVLKESEENLDIFVNQNQILFKTGSLEIVSHLVDGKFPDYQAIIPKQVRSEVFVQRQELLNAVKLTSAFSSRINDVTIKVGENKKFLEVYSASSALGENRYRIPVKTKGDNFVVVFNWRYLLDGLKIYKSENVTLGLNAPDRPVIVRSPNEESLLYVLMPIKA